MYIFFNTLKYYLNIVYCASVTFMSVEKVILPPRSISLNSVDTIIYDLLFLTYFQKETPNRNNILQKHYNSLPIHNRPPLVYTWSELYQHSPKIVYRQIASLFLNFYKIHIINIDYTYLKTLAPAVRMAFVYLHTDTSEGSVESALNYISNELELFELIRAIQYHTKEYANLLNELTQAQNDVSKNTIVYYFKTVVLSSPEIVLRSTDLYYDYLMKNEYTTHEIEQEQRHTYSQIQQLVHKQFRTSQDHIVIVQLSNKHTHLETRKHQNYIKHV